MVILTYWKSIPDVISYVEWTCTYLHTPSYNYEIMWDEDKALKAKSIFTKQGCLRSGMEKTIYFNFSSIFGDFFLRFFEKAE